MTTLVENVSTRLRDNVPDIGEVEFIADLAALIEKDALPQRDSGAYVLPLGIDGEKGTAATGMHIQPTSESVGVVLYVKARGDVKAKKALPAIDIMIDATIIAIVGWAPNNQTVGVFELRRGRLLSASKGLVLYQLDFAIADQLRVA